MRSRCGVGLVVVFLISFWVFAGAVLVEKR